jgi:hypothetical protein
MEYYSAIKMNELLVYITTEKNLRIIITIRRHCKKANIL